MPLSPTLKMRKQRYRPRPRPSSSFPSPRTPTATQSTAPFNGCHRSQAHAGGAVLRRVLERFAARNSGCVRRIGPQRNRMEPRASDGNGRLVVARAVRRATRGGPLHRLHGRNLVRDGPAHDLAYPSLGCADRSVSCRWSRPRRIHSSTTRFTSFIRHRQRRDVGASC